MSPPPEAAGFGVFELAGQRLLMTGDACSRPAGRTEFHAAAGVAAVRDLLRSASPADGTTSWARTSSPKSTHASAGTCCCGTRTACTAEKGERWFLETHAPEVCELPGLRRFFSYRVIDEPVRLPGEWHAE